MRNEVELAPDGTTLRIRFGYRPDLVALVKELPDRRFDGGTKTWSVPARHVEVVYQKLSRHLFEFASDVMSLLAGTMGKPKAEPKPERANATADEPTRERSTTAPPDTLTVSQFNEKVKGALQDHFAERIWLVGEVVDYDKGANKQHKFFALVEKQDGESRPRARIDAVIWDRTATALMRRLQEQVPDFALRDGLEIRVQAKVDFYVPTGRLSVSIEDIDPAFTLGKLALDKEKILRTLREQGLAERNRALPLPLPPLRIGVLTSPAADGWNDFLRHLEQSGVGFYVTLVPVQVQGEKVRATVLAGLRWFAEHADDFDCVCIVRGGGSRTDLAWFDDLEIATAVANHPLKVLIGIGHERDRSVLDEIAHSEKTPTAVAGFLAGTVLDLRRRTADRAVHLQRLVGRLLQRESTRLAAATSSLGHLVHARLRHEWLRLATAARDLGAGATRVVATGRRDLAQFARSLQQASLQACERERHALLRGVDRMKNGTERAIERATARMQQFAARHRLLDPRAVLRRGFAILRDADGKVLPSARRTQAGAAITVQLRDGSVRARTESVEQQS